jgi:Fe-S cluster assembly scaffold protein SufB
VADASLDLLTALYRVYPDATTLMDPHIAHMVVEGHRLMSRQRVPGVEIEARETDDALVAAITVAAGVRVPNPIHTCVGLLSPHGMQRIRLQVRLERGSSAALLAHCLFPNAEQARHEMQATIEIEEGAELRHTEGHFHGPYGGIEVIPQARVRVGRLRLDYKVEAAENAVAELSARVFGHATDEIKIKDELILAGKNSRGLIKTRIAVEQDARSEVVGITHGNAEGARGHMDCTELVRDRAVARAEPIVSVEHPLAKVTHEAAVGTVDQKQLETLMAHGLTPQQAVDVIIMGILR